jgi:hypothetical protein
VGRNKDIYLIMSSKSDPTRTLGENLRDTCMTATNFKRAYDLALSLSGITAPSIGYKSALRRLQNEGAITVTDELRPEESVIVSVKSWS